MTTETTTAKDEDVLVATISRSPSTELRLSLRTYRGRRFADARIWTSTGDGDECSPTSKGVTLDPSLLGQLKRGVDSLLSEASKRAWLE